MTPSRPVRGLTPEGRSKGGRVSAERRRAKAQAKWPGMTPKQIYQSGYIAGYQAAFRRPVGQLRHK